MKKLLLVVALVGVCATAQAKVFAWGAKAGLEMPSFSMGGGAAANSISANNGFHFGFFAQANVPLLGIGVQPEVLYVRRDVAGGVNYFDIPLNLVWGVDLKVIRPFFAVTPYLSYALNDVSVPFFNKTLSRTSYGVGFGGGVDLFRKVQLQGRWNHGLNNLVDDPDLRYRMRGFSLSLGWFF